MAYIRPKRHQGWESHKYEKCRLSIHFIIFRSNFKITHIVYFQINYSKIEILNFKDFEYADNFQSHRWSLLLQHKTDRVLQ